MVKLYRLFYYTFQDLARLNILVDLLQLLDVVLLVEVVVDVIRFIATIENRCMGSHVRYDWRPPRGKK